MKGRQIVTGPLWGRDAAALLVDGRLEELELAPAGLLAFAPGAILRGCVDRLVKGQGGVFLRLPGGERGFLRDVRGLTEGAPLVVQVSGVAEPGKAIPLTRKLALRGRHVVATPGAPGVNVSRELRDPDRRARLKALGAAALGGVPGAAEAGIGMILRSAGGLAEDDDIAAEAGELAGVAAAILADQGREPELLLDAPSPGEVAWRDWAADTAPLSGVEAFDTSGAGAQAEALLCSTVPLAGGGTAVIEPTRAVVAVDVNTGADTSPAAGLKADIALARDLPRQLRLRGLGGQVVVDFAPVPKRDRNAIDQVLRAGFRREGHAATLSGWTAMGLYELARRRDRVPLALLAAEGKTP